MADIAAGGVVVERRVGIHGRSRWQHRSVFAAYALLLPSLLALALFTYGPVLQVAWDSLHLKQSPGAAPTFGGVRNFEAVFADPAFRNALVNNLVYDIGTVGPSLVIALGLALALSRSVRVNNALRAAFFLPVLIPLIAAASLFLFIFLPNVGLLDFYLGHLLAQPPNWLGDPDVALYSIMVLTIWKNAGYGHSAPSAIQSARGHRELGWVAPRTQPSSRPQNSQSRTCDFRRLLPWSVEVINGWLKSGRYGMRACAPYYRRFLRDIA